jgi:hypothetical protein
MQSLVRREAGIGDIKVGTKKKKIQKRKKKKTQVDFISTFRPPKVERYAACQRNERMGVALSFRAQGATTPRRQLVVSPLVCGRVVAWGAWCGRLCRGAGGRGLGRLGLDGSFFFFPFSPLH